MYITHGFQNQPVILICMAPAYLFLSTAYHAFAVGDLILKYFSPAIGNFLSDGVIGLFSIKTNFKIILYQSFEWSIWDVLVA